MSNLQSVLILGPDAVSAASPATAVQLVHACHRWGFSTVVPSSWGDELLAGEVIKRCSAREDHPAIQCSCPRVAERLGANAAKVKDSVFWLIAPPIAAAQYIRAHSVGQPVHITYAGSCPGAIDPSIDQRMSPVELLTAIGTRGIDVAAQPTVFENIIPPDRRRHYSTSAGLPDAQRLWEAAAFRVAQPSEVDLSVGIAQLLLSGERVLIDLTSQVGCVCRADSSTLDPMAFLRAPSPVVREGLVELTRPAPVVTEAVPTVRIPESAPAKVEELRLEPPPEAPAIAVSHKRNSPARPVMRRQGAWRRQTPRTGVVVASTPPVTLAVPESRPFLKRTDVRVAIATAVAVGSLMLGIWLGRHQPASLPIDGALRSQDLRARSP